MLYPSRWQSDNKFVHHWQGKPYIENPTLADYNGQGMVTFRYDDGEYDNYSVALRLHEKYNIPCMFALNTRYQVNFTEEEMRNRQDRRMHEKEIIASVHRGAEIASHLHNHTRMADLTDEQIMTELVTSYNLLTPYYPVTTLIPPNNSYPSRAKTQVINHGVWEAVNIGQGFQNDIPPTDPLEFYWTLGVWDSHTFEDDFKPLINYAIEHNKWCILGFHGIKDPPGEYYETTPTILEQVLEYVASISRNTLLPVNIQDGLRIAQVWESSQS